MSTPLWFHRLVRRLDRFNPDHFDCQILDPNLSYWENVEIARRYHLNVGDSEPDKPP
jgi:hypothetical protein